MLPLQVDLVGGGPVAIVVAFLVSTLFSAVTMHLAALWVLGDEPHQNAVKVAPVPVVVAMLFGRYHALIVLALAFGAAFVAIRYVYDLTLRGTALVTAFYVAISAIFAFAFGNIFLA
jgi:hypothetical protein